MCSARVYMTFNEEVASEERGRCVLFWPTVGAILSGGRPGVSLYIVFIFSRRVCRAKKDERKVNCLLFSDSLTVRTVLPAPSRPMIMTENSSFLRVAT